MNKIISLSFFLFSLSVFILQGQDISGQWTGIAKIQGMQLRIVFHIEATDNGYKSVMDSPDQNVSGIPVTSTTFENGRLTIEIPTMGNFKYTGELAGDSIVGKFWQGGMSFPLNMHRGIKEIIKQKRPQDPVEPYPYRSEDITFPNKKENFVLAGTLTLPSKGTGFPAAILISGSGPQNRDEEIMGHRPFLVISDYLTRKGIAVLRFDDRGTAQSEGNFVTATTADFATDVESAVAYLKTRKEINKNKIGLIGHSEGGIIAPMVASGKENIAFIIMLAGTGVPGDSILLMQQELIARASGAGEMQIKRNRELNAESFRIIKDHNGVSFGNELKKYLLANMKDELKSIESSGMDVENYLDKMISRLEVPWMTSFIMYDPATALEKVKCPVLALNGEKDLQVPPEENLSAIKKALTKAGNKNVTIKEYPGLNHLFQECNTGLPSEYSSIDQTISPGVLDDMAVWILKQTK